MRFIASGPPELSLSATAHDCETGWFKNSKASRMCLPCVRREKLMTVYSKRPVPCLNFSRMIGFKTIGLLAFVFML